MSKIIELLDKLHENSSTTVDIPGRNGDHYRCKALLIKKELPEFELVFPPDAWDADNLVMRADCNIAVEHNGQTINFIARLENVAGNRRLQFTAKESISPESLRDYFRVSINVPIEASYIAGPKEIRTKTWKMTGTTIDLSGSGVLAMFADKPASTHHIQLVMTIPDEESPTVCLADIVRVFRIRRNRYQVAFHFEVISSKTRDRIISCCFQEQRRQLRENVQTTM